MTSPFMCVDLNGIHLTWLSPEKCHNQDCENDLNDSSYLALEKCLNQDCENDLNDSSYLALEKCLNQDCENVGK